MIDSLSPTLARPAARIRLPDGWIVLAAILFACLAMFFVEPRFYSRANLLNVLRNFSLASVVAIGQMFVIMIGGFDMAIGASAALASIAAGAMMIYLGEASALSEVAIISLGVIVGLGFGTLLGIVNGWIVVTLKVTPFMVTLATAATAMGAILYYTKGVPIRGLPDAFTDEIGRGSVLGLPYVVWICALFVGCCWFAFGQTAFGSRLRAVGGNERAALAAGIPISQIKFICYAISGFSGALLGVLLTARIGAADASFGAATSMESIAAAILGGTALGGGAGKIRRVLPAAFLLALIVNALNLARIDSKWQACVLGLILIVAIVLDRK